MVANTSRKLALASLLLLVISGCSHAISSKMRQQARKDLTFPITLQKPSAYVGSIIVWGGVISETARVPDGTLLTILERPLDSVQKPLRNADSRGRFIAKTNEQLDLRVYQKGKKLTLAGEIVGEETIPLGDTQYSCPVVQISELHLWMETPPRYRPPTERGWRRYGYRDHGWGLGL